MRRPRQAEQAAYRGKHEAEALAGYTLRHGLMLL